MLRSATARMTTPPTEAEAQRKTKMLMDKLDSGADFAQLAMDYSEDMNTAATGGDLGYIPESALNQSDPTLKKTVLALETRAGQPADRLKGQHSHPEARCTRGRGAARR